MQEKEKYSRIGLVLKNKRKLKNMTQKELSDKTGISQISIGYYERGQRRPKLEQILKLADALETNPSDLTDSFEYDYLNQPNKENAFFNYLQYIGYLTDTENCEDGVYLIDVIEGSFSEGIIGFFSYDDIDKIDKMVSDFTKKLVFSMKKDRNENNGE